MWSAELTLTNTSSSKRLLTPIKICFPLGAFVCNKQQLSFDENFSAFHWPGASLLVHHVTCKKSLQVTSIWHELFASLSCVSSRAGANYRNRKWEAKDVKEVQPLANHDILLKLVKCYEVKIFTRSIQKVHFILIYRDNDDFTFYLPFLQQPYKFNLTMYNRANNVTQISL